MALQPSPTGTLGTLGTLSTFPLELRQMIYGLTIPEDFHQSYIVVDDTIWTDPSSSSHTLGLLRASRTLRAETAQWIASGLHHELQISDNGFTTNFALHDKLGVHDEETLLSLDITLPTSKKLLIEVELPSPGYAGGYYKTRYNVARVVKLLNESQGTPERIDARLTKPGNQALPLTPSDYHMLLGPMSEMKQPCTINIQCSYPISSHHGQLAMLLEILPSMVSPGPSDAKASVARLQCMIDIILPIAMRATFECFPDPIRPLDVARVRVRMLEAIEKLEKLCNKQYTLPPWLAELRHVLQATERPLITVDLAVEVLAPYHAFVYDRWAAGYWPPENPFERDEWIWD